jgi:hypothetical protein
MQSLPAGGITKEFVDAVLAVIRHLPEWARAAQGNIFIATECLVTWIPGEYVDFKTVRCNNCGECCMKFPSMKAYGDDEEGRCKQLYLEDGKWLCNAKVEKPWCCCQDPINEENCIIEHYRVNLK